MINRMIDIPKNHNVFLFGPRQTGKSTLLKNTFNKDSTLFIDFLDSDTFMMYTTSPGLFKEHIKSRNSKVTHVVINEIQRIPPILNDIHYVIEDGNAPIFAMSGSSARKLKKKHANMLGGRAWIFSLYPFTHKEIGDTFSLHKALEYGTLPPVYLAESIKDAQRTLRAYVDVYLKEEIQAEAIVRNIGAFLKFLPLAADNNGKYINYSNIARETGVSYNTIKEYFQILEDTLIGFYLWPYSASIRKQLMKHPKFYLFDTGVQRAILRRAGVPLEPKTYEYGDTFEHFIILEIIRFANYMEKDFKFSYYRTSNQAEVDLIIEHPDGKVTAIEFKASGNPAPKTLSGLYSFKSVCSKAELFCVCQTVNPYILRDVKIVPWKEIFNVLF